MLAGEGNKPGQAAESALVPVIVGRVRTVFGPDARSVDALDRTLRDEPEAVEELASALSWFARRDQAFAYELAAWAAQAPDTGITQHVRAGRDAYVAGRDQSVINYRRRDE
jgi:hypothetical protein